MFFHDAAKSNLLANFSVSKRDLAKSPFYCIRSPKRFYTAKTQLGHWPVNDPEGGEASRAARLDGGKTLHSL
jgi:hypothetical protein